MKALTKEKLAIHIACNLKRIRNNTELTQQQVADKAEIDRSLYTKYETAASLMSVSNLVKVAYALNVTADELLFGVLEAMQEERDY